GAVKPIRLIVDGFARYTSRQEVDFEGASLFAIAGPTGAGKTLILDAITFALYGKTPRLTQRLESLVSSSRTMLAVDLTFEVATGRYRVVRTIEPKRTTVAKDIRLEELAPGGVWIRVPETEQLREANRKVEELVGLDFEAFTRSV